MVVIIRFTMVNIRVVLNYGALIIKRGKGLMPYAVFLKKSTCSPGAKKKPPSMTGAGG